MPLLKADDIIWIHDYHLILLAAIPAHEWLTRTLFAYGLVGFQTEAAPLHFSHYLKAEAPAETVSVSQFSGFNSTLQIKAFPIGVDRLDYSKGLPNRIRTFC